MRAPVYLHEPTRRDIWGDASDRGGPADRTGHALEGAHRLSHGKAQRERG